MLCFRKPMVAKKFLDKTEGSIEIFRRMFFCVNGQRKFILKRFSVSLNRLSKNCILKSVMSRFFVEFFLSRSTEKLCKLTILCCVSES